MKRLTRYAWNFPEGLLLVLMIAILIDLLAGTLSRYILLRTFYWYEELGRVLLLWIAFVGAVVGVKRGSHFAVTLLFDKLPTKLRLGFSLFSLLFAIGVGVILLITGTSLAIDLMGYETTSLKVSIGAIYTCIPLAGLLIILYLIPQLWKQIKLFITGGVEGEKRG